MSIALVDKNVAAPILVQTTELIFKAVEKLAPHIEKQETACVLSKSAPQTILPALEQCGQLFRKTVPELMQFLYEFQNTQMPVAQKKLLAMNFLRLLGQAFYDKASTKNRSFFTNLLENVMALNSRLESL